MTPQPTPALAALARQTAARGEQPAVVYVDERGHWKWKSWTWLREEVAAATTREPADRALDVGAGLAPALETTAPGRGQAPPLLPEAESDVGWQPSLHGLVHALAAQARDLAAWSSSELARATAALTRPLARGERPIVTAPSALDSVEARAWLTWALESGAALVLPGDAAFLAWAIWWPRATDALAGADELAPLRALLASFGGARARRRQLARLRRIVVHGDVDEGERREWAALGLDLAPFPP